MEHREEWVIVLTKQFIEEKLSFNEIDNYFIGVTYKIIPNIKNNKYKLLTITGVNNIKKLLYGCISINKK